MGPRGLLAQASSGGRTLENFTIPAGNKLG